MSYEEVRKNRTNRDTNTGSSSLSPERGNFPALVDGLITAVGSDDDRSTIAVQLFCRRGKLFARIEDREDRVQLFVELTTLDGSFDAIERALQDPDADWSPTRHRNGN